jgi:hypothetical protein
MSRPVILLSALTVLAALLWPLPASANIGSVTLKTTEVQESKDGEWHIKVVITLPKPPPIMHVPMRFKFQKEVVYERAIMEEGKDPVMNRQVLGSPTSTIVGLDVDFSDPTGRIFKATIFEFDLKRATGFFEAGEYTMQISSSDGDIGGGQKLTLKGDNPPVYRGAMNFAGGSKMQNVSSGLDGGRVAKNDNDQAFAAPTSTDVEAVGTGDPMIPQSAYNANNDDLLNKDHPKGCGCSVPGVKSGAIAVVTIPLLGLVGGVVVRRRGKKRA